MCRVTIDPLQRLLQLALYVIPGHLTIARRPTINVYRFHAYRDKYVTRRTEYTTSFLIPILIFKAAAWDANAFRSRDVFPIRFNLGVARSTTRGIEKRKKEAKKKGKENESVSCKGISMFPCDWWKRGCITMKSFDSQLRGRTYITSVGLEISKGRSILRRDNYLKQQTRMVFPLLTTD